MKWKTKDGRELDVKDMGTTHIENCIKMLQRALDAMPAMCVRIGDAYFTKLTRTTEDIKLEISADAWTKAMKGLKNELRKRGVL